MKSYKPRTRTSDNFVSSKGGKIVMKKIYTASFVLLAMSLVMPWGDQAWTVLNGQRIVLLLNAQSTGATGSVFLRFA